MRPRARSTGRQASSITPPLIKVSPARLAGALKRGSHSTRNVPGSVLAAVDLHQRSMLPCLLCLLLEAGSTTGSSPRGLRRSCLVPLPTAPLPHWRLTSFQPTGAQGGGAQPPNWQGQPKNQAKTHQDFWFKMTLASKRTLLHVVRQRDGESNLMLLSATARAWQPCSLNKAERVLFTGRRTTGRRTVRADIRGLKPCREFFTQVADSPAPAKPSGPWFPGSSRRLMATGGYAAVVGGG